MAAVKKEATALKSERKSEKQPQQQQTSQVDALFTNDIIKTVVESVGFDKPTEDALAFLADDVTFRVKEIIQEAIKFQTKSKRRLLKSCDIDCALRVRNVEPVYGFTSSDFVPFRYASGGGREIYFQEDVEVDLDELMTQSLPKLPLETALKSHWLAIDGIQPSIPENPPPISKDVQLKDSVEPLSKHKHVKEVKVEEFPQGNEKPVKESKKESRAERKRLEEQRKLQAEKQEDQKCKPLVTHELSVEQQLYYKELTEASVGSIETKRTEALQSLSNDPGLYQLLPRFVTFIAEGVRVNVAQHNLAILIYLLRMIKALLENPTLYLEKYLHELIPAIMTCIVSKQLCPRPDLDNHWALRDFAARIMAQICKYFNTPTNNIQSRITKTLVQSLVQENAPLTTHYGAVAGLTELGHEVTRFLVLPRLTTESNLIQAASEGRSNSEKKAAEHLQNLLLKHCSSVIFKTRPPPDDQAQFEAEYGPLGVQLFQKVTQMRASANAR